VKPKLLLHICCAPCATEVVCRLQDEYELVGFFYNPNIHPEEEYLRRLTAAQRFGALWHVPMDTGEYEPGRFLDVARGLEHEPEGGRRCEACFRLRLEESARRARANGCSVVATTLTIGPTKRADAVNRVGEEVCRDFGVRFLPADWKKRDGFRRSVEYSKELGLYRQEYCGCRFSMPGNRAGQSDSAAES